MTLKQIIDLVDTMRPNDFPAEVKTQWLNDLETMIQAEVLLFAPEDVITYDYSVDSNCELLIDKPYEKVYVTYLQAMIEMGNGEYDRYENEMKLFNSFYTSFRKWFTDHYDPGTIHCSGRNSKGFPVYISAYAIAVENGFRGSIKQWLCSLKGDPGSVVRIGDEWLYEQFGYEDIDEHVIGVGRIGQMVVGGKQYAGS